MKQTDSELIGLILDGDDRAFSELVRRWQRPMVSFLLRITGNLDDAMELAQETFHTVFRRLGGLKDRESFSSWIYKIALNHSRMRLRRQRGRQMDSLEELTFENNELKEHYQSLTVGESYSPEEQFSAGEMERVVRAALARLDEKQREVIVLKEYTGLKFHEIAAVLDAPVSTIKSRMYIGLDNLKKEILKIIHP
jgi:RNA polymerase sigma-70 factor (ECF subfamily)